MAGGNRGELAHMKVLRSPLVLISAPLALGLLYFLTHSWFSTGPSLERMAPPGAVLVHRYKNLAVLDRDHLFHLPAEIPSWSAFIALENNVPGLPGVDATRPIFEIKSPPRIRGDNTTMVFPLKSPEDFRKAFLDPGLLARGRIRRAKQIHIHGDHGAIGPTKDVVARVGTGDLSCESRGEDHAIAADIEGLVGLVLAEGRKEPWVGVLDALGVDARKRENMEILVDPATGEQQVRFKGTERLARIARGWRTGRMWAWTEEGRIEIELESRPGAVRDALARARERIDASPAPVTGVPDFGDVHIWAQIPGAEERVAVLRVLPALGVALPPAVFADGALTTAWSDTSVAGELLLLGGRTIGHPYATTLAWFANKGVLPDLGAFFERLPAIGGQRSVPEGALPITVLDPAPRRRAPAGVLLRREVGGKELGAVGASALGLADRIAAGLPNPSSAFPLVLPTGYVRLAAFGLERNAARRVLGAALARGGLFAGLAEGHVFGLVSTDGVRLRLDLRAVDKLSIGAGG
jgi:hypothetical protein